MDSPCFFTGLFRRFRTLVLGREVEIVGQCRFCGECCHGILLQDGRWLKKKRHFDRLCEREPEHTRFIPTGRDDYGHMVFDCSMLGTDNFCTAYDDRLPLCRNYPTKSIYYQGGWIRPECGYRFKSVTFRDVFTGRRRATMPKFSEVLRKEIKRDIKKT